MVPVTRVARARMSAVRVRLTQRALAAWEARSPTRAAKAQRQPRARAVPVGLRVPRAALAARPVPQARAVRAVRPVRLPASAVRPRPGPAWRAGQCCRVRAPAVPRVERPGSAGLEARKRYPQVPVVPQRMRPRATPGRAVLGWVLGGSAEQPRARVPRLAESVEHGPARPVLAVPRLARPRRVSAGLGLAEVVPVGRSPAQALPLVRPVGRGLVVPERAATPRTRQRVRPVRAVQRRSLRATAATRQRVRATVVRAAASR